MRYCCEICMNIVFDDSSEMIGGEGKIVEIDESKFGKQKYNRGRLVEGQWVLGGVCREDKEIFLVPVASHDKETLIPLLVERIRPGSIFSDLDQHDFTHLTVNHSLNFVDPVTGCHTQNVESMW